MAISGDRFAGQFEEHTIEVVRTNLDKRVVVLVDGVEVARESVALPRAWSHTRDFRAGSCGQTHAVVASSTVRTLFGVLPVDNTYAIEIDGSIVPLERMR